MSQREFKASKKRARPQCNSSNEEGRRKLSSSQQHRIIEKLSTGLLGTYESINDSYYRCNGVRLLSLDELDDSSSTNNNTNITCANTNIQSPPPDLDDNTGTDNEAQIKITKGLTAITDNSTTNTESQYVDKSDYKFKSTSEEFNNGRYVFSGQIIGRGSFGQVIKALDRKSNEQVAIKIIKNKKSFWYQSQTEIRILKLLTNNSKECHHRHIVKLLDTFKHYDHQCLVFELLGDNLYEVLKATAFEGIALSSIKQIATQVLSALEFLSHKGVIHADLKPENLLLSSQHTEKDDDDNNSSTTIKVIDFGSSCKSTKTLYQYIQSRFYRSPEVILGCSYDVPIDIWSLGCILAELYIGEPLFGGTDQVDQLARIVQLRGMPPRHMITSAPESIRSKHFKRSNNEYKLLQGKMKSFSSSLAKRLGIDESNSVKLRGKKGFLDLLEKMLTYSPDIRITATEALKHPFLRKRSKRFSEERTRYPRACKKQCDDAA